MAIQKQADSICNYLLFCIYGIASSPKAGGLKQSVPAVSRIIPVCTFTPHTLSKKKIQQELNRNRQCKKQASDACASPTAIQTSVLPFCSMKWTGFCSCLIFEYFLRHLYCCAMETLQLHENCLFLVTRTSRSPGSLGMSLASLALPPSWLTFPCPARLPWAVPWGAHLHALIVSLGDIQPPGTRSL